MLHPVWLQTRLFPENVATPLPSRWLQVSDEERDRRTPGQWLRAVRAYLEFRSGNAWRRMSDQREWWSPERLYYVGAIRFLNELDAAARPVSAPALAKSTDELRAAKLSQFPRSELVAQCLQTNPNYTDAKLLSHFTRAKLARLLVEAQNAASAPLERAS